MINLNSISTDLPHSLFKNYYNEAMNLDQKLIEAVVISSFGADLNEIESRYVNLKYIINDEWIFFSNYNSKKSLNFKSHDQISALFYWDKLNLQIRIKAKIRKSSNFISDNHYDKRNDKKNAISHSSNQSQSIDSYESVIDNYSKYFKNKNLLSNRPDYWGGYSFFPYYFEFWKGHEFRINKRVAYEKVNDDWKKYFLQP